MAISNHSANKFAFLFTGSASLQYVEDLRKVTTTLLQYYGYDPANVTVISGEVINEFDKVLYPDPSSIFQTAGLTPLTLSGADAAALSADMDSKISTFIGALTTEKVAGYSNSVFFYFTGIGTRITIPINKYSLQIAMDGTTPVTIDQIWLTSQLNSFDFTKNNINLLLQHSYSYGFFEGIGGINSISDINLQLTFTSACDSAEVIAINAAGSEFTDFWTKGLQCNTRLVGAVNKYADEEDTNTAVSPAPSNAEDTLNLLISFKKAYFFAKSQSILTAKFDFKGLSEDYPGLPSFLIRDGDDQVPAQAWCESPDIYINVLGNDSYHPGQTETIHILVKNNGTHPVRSYYLGYKHFGSGLGPTQAINVVNRLLGSGLASLMKPGVVDNYNYQMFFDTSTTHNCIKARAKLLVLTNSEIDEYSDWSNTLIQVNDFEAQRNIDPVSVGPPPSDPTPEPDHAQNPDPDPQPDQHDQNNTGDRTLINIRSFKEHVYTIVNPFKEKRTFRLVIHKEFQKYSKLLDTRFYLISDEKKTAFEPLRICRLPYPHIPFGLEPEKQVRIMVYIALKPKSKIEELIRLPLEVYVEKKGRVKFSNLRKPMLKSVVRSFIPVSGITIKLLVKDLSITGSVLNREGKPVPDAIIKIRTLNGLQSAILKTDEKGHYQMLHINPDSYKMSVKTKEWQSRERVVNLFDKNMEVDFHENEKSDIDKPVN